MTKSEWKKVKEKFLQMQKDGRLEEIEDVPQDVEEKVRKVAKNLMKKPYGPLKEKSD